jgi:AcrR family transcriptional regulator
MNPEVLRQRLIKVARNAPHDSSVPPGFERRVMRAIVALPSPDPLDEWLLGLRRAAVSAASLAAITALLHVCLPSASTAAAESLPEPDPWEAALMADVSSLLNDSLSDEPTP